jgi:hypothetical protein
MLSKSYGIASEFCSEFLVFKHASDNLREAQEATRHL